MKKLRTGATIQGVKHKGGDKGFVSLHGQAAKSSFNFRRWRRIGGRA